LINQNRENTKNDLVAVNMNIISTTQIKTNSCRTTQVREPNNRYIYTGSPLREIKERFEDLLIADPA
jgi:hypothetical protein